MYFDFVILGSGIIGLTIGYELKKKFPNSTLAIIEKEENVGAHASGRNSGVLHSGVYYASDSIKSKVCASGSKAMMAFAQEHELPFRQSGKLIVATSENEIPSLQKLLNNAVDNGLDVFEVDRQSILEHEPYCTSAISGIYTPDTAVIDPSRVVRKLKELLEELGACFFGSEGFTKVSSDRTILTDKGNQISYGHLFNCTGSYAETVAKKFGIEHEYILIPFKGLYWKIKQQKKYTVQSNIYPVPDPRLPFLGVHLTRSIDGDVYAGPTAIPAFGRENYGILRGLNFFESIDISLELLSLYFSNNENFRMLVHNEISKYSKRKFFNDVNKLVPDIEFDDLIPSGKVGIRPQLVNKATKKLEMDYVILNEKNSTHVLNAISPAFTSSFAFANYIIDSSQI